MWRWHWERYGGWRAVKIFLDSAAGVEKWRAVAWGGFLLILSLGSTSAASYVMSAWEGLPWWVVPAFILGSVLFVFVRGLMKANYEEFQKVEGRRDVLQRELDARKSQATPERPRMVAVHDEGTGTRIIGSSVEVGQDYAGDVFGVISRGSGASIQSLEMRARSHRKGIESASTDAARRFYSGSISDKELTRRCHQLSDEIWQYRAERDQKMRLWREPLEGFDLATEEGMREYHK